MTSISTGSGSPGSGGVGEGGLAINAPDLGADLKPRRVAIKDASQAAAIARSLEQANRERSIRAGKVVALFDGQPPKDQARIRDTGASISNFSTHSLAGIVSRVYPQFEDLVHNARYLTMSQLPDTAPGSGEKTTAFRDIITRRIRSWRGWRDFVTKVSIEDVLMGYLVVVYTDEYSVWPQFVKQDATLVAAGCGQYAGDWQVLVKRESYQIHEFIDMLVDQSTGEPYSPEVLDAAGWNIENCVNRINNATQQNPALDSASIPNYRALQDLVREGTIGMSYTTGARVVDVWHVFGREYDGRVSHWIVSRDDGSELFYKYGRFASFADFVMAFTFMAGNLTLHGTRGLGRELFNICVAIEKAHNQMADCVHYSSLTALRCDAKSKSKIAAEITGPFLVVSKESEFATMSAQASPEGFLALIAKLTAAAEQSAGAYIPGQVTMGGSSSKTATEASIDNQREEMVRKGILARFWGQFQSDLVSIIQRRLCDPTSPMQEAKECIEEMKAKGLTDADIAALSAQSAANVTASLPVENQGIQQIAQAFRGDPDVDQHELKRRLITSTGGQEMATALLVPGIDQTVTAEASRMQLMECQLMDKGIPAPISPRDNHEVHLQTLDKVAEMIFLKDEARLVNDTAHSNALDLYIQHMEGHLKAMQEAKVKPEALKPYIQSLQQFKQLLEQADKAHAQAQAAAGMPIGAGAPPQGAAPVPAAALAPAPMPPPAAPGPAAPAPIA